jgi:hypothetical protein
MGKLADEIRATTARANRIAYYKLLLSQGKTVRAAAYAKTYSLPTEGPEVDATPVHVPVVVAATAPAVVAAVVEDLDSPAIVDEPVAEPSNETETHINGWPKKSKAKIWRIVANPALVAIKLMGEDDRVTSMWAGRGGKWQINAIVDVVLDKPDGDPIYKFVKGESIEVPIEAVGND